MAAPTPVSSLVHSSTLVTAGIYLLVRFNYLLEDIYFLLAPISLITIILAGACAVYELDFKKVVAMSTLSQLGFIVFSISSGFWLLSFLHITFHAFFKSCLFLSTGRIIHLLLGDQDSRNFGSLGLSNFSKMLFSMRRLSLMGFPFSLGFYSKDSILGEILFSVFDFSSFLFALGCCFTVAYRCRLVYMAFSGFPSFFSNLLFSEDKFFYLPIILLYSFCVFIGNFFFFNFLPPVVFSFLDFFVGLIIISGGLIFFVFSPFFYFLNNFLAIISFLSVITSSFFSSFSSFFNFSFEHI
jgi:NADH-ubiquinone oxidoreductase chain 5